MNLRIKFLGGMVGSALGDAIGELAFRYRSRAALEAAVAARDVLVYTDDTAMALGLAESLTHVGRIDVQHLGDTFRANYRREPWRGYAVGPPTIFGLVEGHGLSYGEAARSLFGGQGSYGNGAAMRIAPVGLAYHDAPDLYDVVRASASVTHAHPIAIDGAAVLAWTIARVVRLDPKGRLPIETLYRGLVDFARTDEIRDGMQLVTRYLAEKVPPGTAAVRLGYSVAAHASVPYAIYAFLRHPKSYSDCLHCAVLHSADRDTVGAMACALSGAYLGVGAIPLGWWEKLENREYIEALAGSLAIVGSERRDRA